VTLSVVAPLENATEYIDATGTLEDEQIIKGPLLTRINGEDTDLGARGPFVATRRR